MEKETYCNGSVVLPFGRRADAVEASKIAVNKFRHFNSTKNILGLPINPSMQENHMLSPRIEIDCGVKLCLITPLGDEIYYQRHCLILPVRGDITTCRIPLSWLAIVNGKIPALVAEDMQKGKCIVGMQSHPLGQVPFYNYKLLFLRQLKDCL